MRMTLDRAAVGVLALSIFAAGCSQAPSAPSPSRGGGFATSSSADGRMADAPGLSLEHLEASGWDCRPAPFNPTRTTCSHPNQPHPVSFSGPPPPPDRPASISLRVFDNGRLRRYQRADSIGFIQRSDMQVDWVALYVHPSDWL